MDYSILNVNDNEYLISLVNIPQKIQDRIANVDYNVEAAWVRHLVSSSCGYSVYEVYGDNALKLIKKIQNILNKLAIKK